MKQNEIEVGKVYWTKVSGERIQVLVAEKCEVTSYSSGRIGTKYRVRNVRTGESLPKLRSASALSLTGGYQGASFSIHHPGTDKTGHPISECQTRGCK